MASADPHSVTIDRAYFDTLVRRARFNSDAVEGPTPPLPFPANTVTISKVEYESLGKIARQYANLRQNLLRGGVGEDTIDLLSSDESTWHENQPPPATLPSHAFHFDGALQVTAAAAAGGGNVENGSGFRDGYTTQHSQSPAVQRHYGHHDWAAIEQPADVVSLSMDAPAAVPNGCADQHHQPPIQRPQFERLATRTIQLSNLPESVTHADITGVVRGGPLLDVFLRNNERSAAVSFLHAADAKDFYNHVRRHDLYIKNKRVKIKWSDRQFILPGHVANKIGIGATRNLVIRRCDPKHKEDSVREDLEHIHNLIVIRVRFVGGSCFISTNSVHNAMFARTCMMSRLKYKGSKIDWDADECALPLEKVQAQTGRREAQTGPKRGTNPMANRFQLLDLDGGEDESEHEVPPGFRTNGSVDITA